MPVTSTGSQESELHGNIGQSRAQIGVVARMTGFHRVQALGFEPLDHGAGAAFLKMRRRNQTTGVMNYVGDRTKGGETLLHEGGAPPADEAVKGIGEVCGSPVADNGARDVRSSKSASGRLLKHAFKREIDPEPVKMLNHLVGSAEAICPAALQERLQIDRTRWKEVSEHVHLAPGGQNRKLASSDHPHSTAIARGERGGYSGESVVIGEGNGVQACSQGASDNSLGRKTPIRSSRMHVQVDGFGLSGVWRRIQRRYPVSGEVQDGWE